MSKIKNQYGEEINLEAAAMIMDIEYDKEGGKKGAEAPFLSEGASVEPPLHFPHAR